MKITEINCETGETIERDMTAEEETAHNIIVAEQLARKEIQLAEEAEIAAKIAAKESALAKLQAIGLTEEEAKSIVG